MEETGNQQMKPPLVLQAATNLRTLAVMTKIQQLQVAFTVWLDDAFYFEALFI